MSGYEATEIIRELERELYNGDHHTIIIALSAGSEKNEKNHCLNSGMNDYISKPINLATLKGVLVKWLADTTHPFPIENTFLSTQNEKFNSLDKNNPTGEESDFHYEKLLSKMNGKVELVNEILEMLKQGIIDQQLDDLFQEINHKIHEAEVRKIAHKLKGSFSTLYFTRLTELAKEMENLNPWDWEIAYKISHQIKERFQKILEEI